MTSFSHTCVLTLKLELGSKICPCNIHVLCDTIYFCNGKYKGMFHLEAMLVVLNVPLKFLTKRGIIRIHEFFPYCINFAVIKRN